MFSFVLHCDWKSKPPYFCNKLIKHWQILKILSLPYPELRIKFVTMRSLEIYKHTSNILSVWVNTWQLTLAGDTRKPIWRKGKHATAVRVWRPLAKNSTVNQRYAISYWWLIVTMAALLTVCETFSRVQVENCHFCPLYCDCWPLAEECPPIST